MPEEDAHRHGRASNLYTKRCVPQHKIEPSLQGGDSGNHFTTMPHKKMTNVH